MRITKSVERAVIRRLIRRYEKANRRNPSLTAIIVTQCLQGQLNPVKPRVHARDCVGRA